MTILPFVHSQIAPRTFGSAKDIARNTIVGNAIRVVHFCAKNMLNIVSEECASVVEKHCVKIAYITAVHVQMSCVNHVYKTIHHVLNVMMMNTIKNPELLFQLFKLSIHIVIL